MAETLITNQTCGACGSEVREHSMFCYHCGGALEAQIVSDGSPSDAWFREEIVEKNDGQSDVNEVAKPAKKVRNSDKTKEDIENRSDETKSEAVTSETPEETPTVNVSLKPFKERVKKKRRRRKTKLEAIDDDLDKNSEVDNEASEVKIEEKPEDEKSKELVETKVDEVKTSQAENKKLKSASALRKRTKPSRIRKVEIVWEERDSSPNIWFIVCALILSALVAGLVFLAFYLK